MKRKYLGMLLVVALFAGYTAYYSNLQQDKSLFGVSLANLEALADSNEVDGGTESVDCNNKNGYRQWSTSGFLQRKKEFYDCCSILQSGYGPTDNCR